MKRSRTTSQDKTSTKAFSLRALLRPRSFIYLLTTALIFGTLWSEAEDTDVTLEKAETLSAIDRVHESAAEHASQSALMEMLEAGSAEQAFLEAFELGDELFATEFNTLDGIGANVGDGQRFTRVPRADLDGPGQWANHVPYRHTGPNAQSCTACHIQAFEDGAGNVAVNAVRDPLRTGRLDSFISRNTTHVFGSGALQRLAEEMTDELHAVRDEVLEQAEREGKSVTLPLVAKGVDFGSITALANGELDTDAVAGVDTDLVIKAYQWKGSERSLRSFVRDASNRELGMQAVELVGAGFDGDFDSVVDEFGIGDITALTIYLAAQPRPTTKTELSELGLIEPLSLEETASIEYGEQLFTEAGCAGCHTPSLSIDNPIYSEPSQHPSYRDATFPGGQIPETLGVMPEQAITFDLTEDLPDNHIERADGSVFNLGAFQKDAEGRAIVRLYSDLKRHDMGAKLAEPVNEDGIHNSVFITKELWGLADTAPYLHDGRATTLSGAILEHGGEAAASRDAFVALTDEGQNALVSFLNNLVLFKLEEDDH